MKYINLKIAILVKDIAENQSSFLRYSKGVKKQNEPNINVQVNPSFNNCKIILQPYVQILSYILLSMLPLSVSQCLAPNTTSVLAFIC